MNNGEIGEPAFAIHDHSIFVVRGCLSAPRRQELVQFWLRHGAIANLQEALRRTQEIVCLAVDKQNRISGVSTVYIESFGLEKHPYWFYRTFIRPDCRLPGIAVRIFRATLQCLTTEQCEPDRAPRGLVIVTENRRLTRPGARVMFRAEGLRFLSSTADGMDVWIHDLLTDSHLVAQKDH